MSAAASVEQDSEAQTAAAIRRARSERQTIAALPFPLDLDAAYRVQRLNVGGARRSGFKIGLTSEPVRRQLGASEPDFGVLLAGEQGPGIDVSTLIQPRIEAEIALLLSRDLPSDLRPEDAADYVASAYVAAEIVDSIFQEWRFDVVGAVADNGCAAAYRIGAPVALDGLDLKPLRMEMFRNGELVSSGTGAATMGDPLNALAWLAREAPAHGERPRAGDLILTGALGPMVDLKAGDSFRIEIERLGSLEVSAHDA